MKKHIMFLHLWEAIDHTIILALSFFPYFFLVWTDEYLPHTVLDWKVVDPQATTSSSLYDYNKQVSTCRKCMQIQKLCFLSFYCIYVALGNTHPTQKSINPKLPKGKWPALTRQPLPLLLFKATIIKHLILFQRSDRTGLQQVSGWNIPTCCDNI